MKNQEKAKIEATLKNILYFVEDEKDQEKMIEILKKYNHMLPDGRFKDGLQKLIFRLKKNYYDQVDCLVKDILNCPTKDDEKVNKIILDMLKEIKSTLEKAERTFWDRLCDLFKWS